MEYMKILCYDIKYKDTSIIKPKEVEIRVAMPADWRFEFMSAKLAVKAVLESETGSEVIAFDWRPI